ncbi:MAG: hypothetical protein JWM68_3223 [Verrucomicrobiales bacterium]|nr:hypothetical protein [Verrucomicrobiales bacterium]
MNRLNVLFAAVAAAFITSCATTSTRAPESAFTPIFDGKTLNGWTYSAKQKSGYYITNGVLVSPKNCGADLFTQKEYSDFVLRLDFKLSPGANNGVAIRSPLENGQIAYIGNEVQVLDDTSPEYAKLDPAQYCGSLYRLLPAKRGQLKKVGEWNSYEITAKGRYIKVVLNGVTITEGNLNSITDPATLQRHTGMFRPKGHIGFLGHHRHTEFRNIRIRELPKFVERDNTDVPEGFTSLFNGRDLAGWKGLVSDPIKRKDLSPDELAREQTKADLLMQNTWKVEDGQLAYHGKMYNNLCTKKDFRDFEMLIDWKVEPKADSGLYLRGCPQVQIWEPNSNQFDKKHPGSGGLFNNQKGPNYPSKFADHYAGDWNRFRVVMVGEKVHVYLNNELVVENATLENYWDRSQPVFPVGPLELQAHNSVVYFKNIYVREIAHPEPVEK